MNLIALILKWGLIGLFVFPMAVLIQQALRKEVKNLNWFIWITIYIIVVAILIITDYYDLVYQIE